MNNVVQFSKYQPDFNTNSEIFFPVYSQRNFSVGHTAEYDSANPVAVGYQAVVNRDTNQVIGVHGSRYKLTPNSEVFPLVDKALQLSDLSLNGLQVKDELSHNGARTFRQYLFPDHSLDIGTNDKSCLRLIIKHSYDGSAAMSFEFGMFRAVCSNGMVAGDSLSKISHKNTLGLDVSLILNQLNSTFTLFMDHVDDWKRWATTPVRFSQAIEVIDSFPGINPALRTKLLNNWLDEVGDNGYTLWSLYNALTQWSSHADISDSKIANSASIINQRETRVKQAMSKPQFMQLALAA